jgi:hypothetical protein
VPQHRPAEEDGVNGPGHAGFVVRAGVVETVVAVSLIAVAAWLWFGCYSFDEGGRGLMGAAAFPRGVAVLLGLSSLVLGAKGVRQMVGPGTDPVTVRRPSAVLLAAVLIVLYPLLLPRFGFYPTTGVWLLALLWCAGQRNILWALVTVLVFLVVVKLVFQMAMGIPLP